MGTLYLVSTPIGNLGDLGQRAVEVLREVDVILAEDTRRTSILLRHYGIGTRTASAHQHNEAARAEALADWLAAGREVALVSDAGTPLLSDPGGRLVAAALAGGHRVVPVPGPSAILAALAGAGLPADRFTFFGFPPRGGGERDALLGEVLRSIGTSVLFEAPGRTPALLADLDRAGAGDRRAVVARELTKRHEEFVRGTVRDLAARFAEAPPRGEVVLVVEGGRGEDAGEDEARRLARALLEAGASPRVTARAVRDVTGVSRNDAYALVQGLTREE